MQTGWANAVVEAAGILLGAGYVYLTYRDRYLRYKADHDALMVLTMLDAKGGLDLHALELKKFGAVAYDIKRFERCDACGYSVGDVPANERHWAKNQMVRIGHICQGKGKKCPGVPHFHPSCKECGYSFLMAPDNVKL